jgi:hypothetical protein
MPETSVQIYSQENQEGGQSKDGIGEKADTYEPDERKGFYSDNHG